MEDKSREQLISEVDELRRRLAEMQAELDRFRGFSEHSPTIAWMKDEAGRHVYLSKSYEKCFGVRLEDWLGKTDFEVWPPETAREFHANDLQVLSTGRTIEVVEETVAPDNRHHYWRNYKFPFQDARGNRYVGGIGFDITEQKKSADALHKALQKLDAHMENTPAAVIEFDPSFRIIRWSGEAERIFGWKGEEIIGRAIAEIPWVHKDDMDLVEKISSEMSKGLRPKNLNINRNYTRDGRIIYCEWHNSAIYDDQGRLSSIMSFVLDITARKKAELELETYSKKLETLVSERTNELENKKRALEELNAALKVLLQHREEDRKELEQMFVANIRKLVVPFLDKLHTTSLSPDQAEYLEVIEGNLNGINSPFLRTLATLHMDLTPREIEVADLVRDGKTAKEISKLLSISSRSVEFHKDNIRRKLNLTGRKINLRSHLMSLV